MVNIIELAEGVAEKIGEADVELAHLMSSSTEPAKEGIYKRRT